MTTANRRGESSFYTKYLQSYYGLARFVCLDKTNPTRTCLNNTEAPISHTIIFIMNKRLCVRNILIRSTAFIYIHTHSLPPTPHPNAHPIEENPTISSSSNESREYFPHLTVYTRDLRCSRNHHSKAAHTHTYT